MVCVVVRAGGGLRERNGGHTWSKNITACIHFFKQQRVLVFYQTKRMVSGERDEETVWTRAFWVVFKGYLTCAYCVIIETSSRAASGQFPFTPSSSCLAREESFDKGAGPCSSRIAGLPILAVKPCPGSYHHLTLVFLYENRYNDIYSVCVTRGS